LRGATPGHHHAVACHASSAGQATLTATAEAAFILRQTDPYFVSPSANDGTDSGVFIYRIDTLSSRNIFHFFQSVVLNVHDDPGFSDVGGDCNC